MFTYIHFLSWLDGYNEFTLSDEIFKPKKFNSMLSLGFVFLNSFIAVFAQIAQFTSIYFMNFQTVCSNSQLGS